MSSSTPILNTWVDTIINSAGQVLPNVTIYVLTGTVGGTQAVDTSTTPGSPLATIYADPYGATPINQSTTPLNTSAGSGTYQFWATPGYYVIQAFGPGINGQLIQGISLTSGISVFSGSIAANQVAVGSSLDVISGSNALTFTPTTLTIANLTPATSPTNESPAPSIAVSGSYYTGSGPAVDTFSFDTTMQGNVISANAAATLTLNHVGSQNCFFTLGPGIYRFTSAGENILGSVGIANLFVQTPGTNGNVFNLVSAAAAVGSLTTYTGNITVTLPRPGAYVTVAGFSNAGNNGRFIVQGSTSGSSGTVTVYNSGGVLETHAATLTFDNQTWTNGTISSTGYGIGSFPLFGSNYAVTMGSQAEPNSAIPFVVAMAGNAMDAGYLRIVNNGATGNHGLEIGAVIDGTGAAPVLLQVGHFNGQSTVNLIGSLTFQGSTSGAASISVAAAAGSPATLLLPTTTGTSGYVLATNGGSPQQLSWVANGSGGGSPAFSVITSGTNTNTLTIGTGGSLVPSGSGTIEATQILAVVVSGTAPTSGQVLTASSGTAASWQAPAAVTAFSAVTSATNTNALVIGTGGSLGFTSTGTIAATTLQAVVISNSAPSAGQILTATGSTGASWQSPAAPAFNTITAATNVNALVVGSGGSLLISGTGKIEATQLLAVILNATAPTTGQVLVASSATAASWQTPASGSSFSAITSATNTTAAMVVGTGASINVSGTGTINATQVAGNTFSTNTTTAGQVPIYVAASTQFKYGFTHTSLINVVTEYGADPTGAADASTVVQSAMAAVSASRPGLYFPAGTYKIGTPITDPTSGILQAIVGDGTGITTITTPNNTSIFNLSHVTDGSHLDDFILRGITFTTSFSIPTSVSTTNGVSLKNINTSGGGANVSQVCVDNCDFQYFTGAGLYVANPILCSLKSITTYNCGQGIYVDGTANSNYGFTTVNFQSCYGLFNVGAAYRLQGGTGGGACISFVNCAADSNGTGYLLQGCNVVTFSGCDCESSVPNNQTPTLAARTGTTATITVSNSYFTGQWVVVSGGTRIYAPLNGRYKLTGATSTTITYTTTSSGTIASGSPSPMTTSVYPGDGISLASDSAGDATSQVIISGYQNATPAVATSCAIFIDDSAYQVTINGYSQNTSGGTYDIYCAAGAANSVIIENSAPIGAIFQGATAGIVAGAGATVSGTWPTQTVAITGSTINAQTVSYTAVLGDNQNLVTINDASANNFTVPPNSSVAFPVGAVLTVSQLGAGQITLVAGAGVTINSPGGSLTARAQYSTVFLTKLATNTWLAGGDLT